MAAYHLFTTARGAEPDPPTLLAQLRGIDATIGVQHTSGGQAFTFKKNTDWTSGQIASAQTVLDTCPPLTSESIAQAEIDNMPIATQALVLVLLDLVNMLRGKTGLVTMTAAQIMQAIRDKAATL